MRLVFGVGGVGPEVGHGGFCEFWGGGWNGCLGLLLLLLSVVFSVWWDVCETL